MMAPFFPVKKSHGIVLPAVVAVTSALFLLFVLLIQINKNTSRKGLYLQSMMKTYRLAESGLHNALGQLVNDPTISNPNSFLTPTLYNTGTTQGGEFENFVQRSDNPVPSGYYIMTSATENVSGKLYSSKLHTYAEISNVSLYFAAINDDLTISHGADLNQGRVYSPRLRFLMDNPPAVTRLYKAEFVETCVPAPADWDDPAVAAAIDISTPANKRPVQLTSPLIFPEILDADLLRYKNWAGPHITTNSFTGDIYPPGYEGGQLPGDTYANHTDNNQHHIYYFDGDMYVEGVVHGQVLFVATGDIYITGNLTSADLDDPPVVPLPGALFPSSSTAHQPVLITKKDVIIEAGYYQGTPATSTQTIQALVIAPQGTLYPGTYPDPNLSTPENEAHDDLTLNFTGSLILRTLNNPSPTNLVTVFGRERTYNYMSTLATRRPPYLPMLIEIHYMLEETGPNDFSMN